MANIKILDGGFSAQLSKHVGEKIDGDPLWTARFLATNPDAVYATHLDFLRAGSDIIETNTYQASIPGLMEHLSITKEESIELLRKAVQLAKRAIDDYTREIELEKNVRNKKPLIAGACGPYGASLHDGSEYNGAYGKTTSQKTIIEWHRPRIQALIDGGIDLLALETIPCHQEAEALVELLKDFPDVKAWFSFSCQGSKGTMVDGSNFQEVALQCYKRALPGQLVAIGVNCLAPKDVSPLLKDINNGRTDDLIPLIVYPNSGENYIVNEGWVKGESNELLESFVEEWLGLGVKYIGGCCRIYADNIKTICKEVQTFEEKVLAGDEITFF